MVADGINKWTLTLVTESGRNPAKKHRIQPECNIECADAGRGGRTRLAGLSSQAQIITGKCSFALFSWPRVGLATIPG